MSMSITLRTIKVADADAYFKMTKIEEDPELKYVRGLVANTFEDTKQQVKYLSELDFKHDFGFLVCQNKTPVGFIIATQDRTFTECLNVAAFVKKDSRGLGIMTEAMFLFINYLKSNTWHKSLLFDISAENLISIKSAEKMGCYFLCNIQYDNSEYCRYIKQI